MSKFPHSRTTLRRCVAGAVAAAAALTTLVAGTAPAAAGRAGHRAAVPVLDWQPCAGASDFQCANAQVPLDYDQPSGDTITIAVIRHLATDPAHRVGSLFFNPGGPGGSGTLNLPFYYPRFAAQLRSDFDIVSFDPRGIQASTSVRCLPSDADEAALLGQLPAGFPVGPSEQQKWIDVFREFDADCGAHTGPVLGHLSTANVARDMDLLREAVGDPSLNYVGPSYGSYLGATYANLFPDKVRAMLLESNIDATAWADSATSSVLGTLLRQGSDLGSAQTLQYFLTQCGLVGTDRCAFSAGSPSATTLKFNQLLARLKAGPITVDGTSYTYAATLTTVLTNLYFTQPVPEIGIGGYPGLARLLQSLSATPAATGATRAPALRSPALDSGYVPSGTGGQLGVLCTDSPHPASAGSYVLEASFAKARSGPIGETWGWAEEACATWPVPADPDRYTGPFNRLTKAKILVAGITNDPATPYQSSVNLAHELANAQLLTVQGSGHDLFFNNSACADDYASQYFISGTLASAAPVCRQDAPPF